MAGLAVASVTFVPWAWSGCAGADVHPTAQADSGSASPDATVCSLGGAQCVKGADCCSLLCLGERCADETPPGGPPSGLVCDEDSGTYLGTRQVQGAPCGSEGLVCEFGGSRVVACDTIASCKGGLWQVSPPDLTDPACAPSSSSCSPDWGAVPVAQSCTPANARCEYSSGQCECGQNAPVPGWPFVWKCAAPVLVGQGSCPTIRPALGTPCRELGSTCDYGVCKLRGGNRQACLGWPGGAAPSNYGRWVDVPVECACPSSPPDSGAPCSNFELSCEYGSAAFAQCDIYAGCRLSNSTTNATDTAPVGVWTLFVPDGGPPCAPAPADACPPPSQPIEGMPCSSPSRDCDYADKRCECANGPTPQSETTWRCTDPLLAGPGCGARPRLGTPCPQEGLVCNYGVCEIDGGSFEVCQGVWTGLGTGCLPTPCPPTPPVPQSPPVPPGLPPPPNPPMLLMPCDNAGGGICEYGTSNVVVCDTLVVCAPTKPSALTPAGAPSLVGLGGQQQLIGPDAGNPSCGTSDASACPASFATVPRGASCDGGPAFCDYAEGRCQCAPSAGSPSPTWSCQDPPTLCPRPRPRLGTACTQEGRVCAYGSCGSADSETQMCRGAVWVALALDCSVDAASLFGPVDAAAAP
jgi:hypothetical protein